MDFINKIFHSECLKGLQLLPDNCMDVCVTSPPYWGLRDYGTAEWIGGEETCNHFRDNKNNNPDSEIQTRGKVDSGVGDAIYKDVCGKCGAIRVDEQLGLEKTPEEYVGKLVKIFHQVKRVLKPTGTLWLNLGDSYWGGKGMSGTKDSNYQDDRHKNGESINASHHQIGGPGKTRPQDGTHETIKPKDLVGIPWMVAFALRPVDEFSRGHERWKTDADGNYVRNKRTVWSVSTKPFKEAHFATFPQELIEPCIKAGSSEHGCCEACGNPWERIIVKKGQLAGRDRNHGGRTDDKSRPAQWKNRENPTTTKTVGWQPTCECNGKFIVEMVQMEEPGDDGETEEPIRKYIPTIPLKDHPIVPARVLEPFSGAGTTPLVATKLSRNWTAFELNKKYIGISDRRMYKEIGMFL